MPWSAGKMQVGSTRLVVALGEERNGELGIVFY